MRQVYLHNSGQVVPAPGDVKVNLKGLMVGNGCTIGVNGECYARQDYVDAKARAAPRGAAQIARPYPA